MSHTDYHTLVNQGRKAGLRTSEMYPALATRHTPGEVNHGETDSNGYTSRVNAEGHPVLEPKAAR